MAPRGRATQQSRDTRKTNQEKQPVLFSPSRPIMLNAGQKYCRMLQGEHSAILSTFIKLSLVIKIFVLSIYEWPHKTGFTVCCKSSKERLKLLRWFFRAREHICFNKLMDRKRMTHLRSFFFIFMIK